jgi:acyl-CoA synthetase (AMP-forming)/AMP-acid ligase II
MLGDNHILNLFKEAVEEFPDKTAIIEKKHSISFSELLIGGKKRAQTLLDQGIAEGDCIIIYIPMSIALYETIIAILWIGAIPVFIDNWSNRERIEHCTSQIMYKGVIAGKSLQLLRPFYSSLRSLKYWIRNDRAPHETQRECTKPIGDEALITFTTGSTGAPKGAIRSHAFLYEQFKQLSKVIPANPKSVTLVSLPIVLLMNLGSGTTSIIPRISTPSVKTGDIQKIIKQIKLHRVDRIIASPALLLQIAKSGKLESIQEIYTGGGPVFPIDSLHLIKGFPNAAQRVIFGSTEAEPVSFTDIATVSVNSKKAVFVGNPVDSIQLKIIDIDRIAKSEMSEDEFGLVTLKSNTVGDIVVSGPQVLSIYTDQDYSKKNKIRVGNILWHILGDAGYIDDNGALNLLGRTDHRIRVGSDQFIYPFEVKITTDRMPDILDSAPFDRGNGFEIAIVKKKGVSKSEVEKHIAKAFPSIVKIHIVSKIPKDARHETKVDVTALLKLLS